MSCVGRAAYLASKVRAMTPAAMEEESEVLDLARLQRRSGPSVTCRGHQMLLANISLSTIKGFAIPCIYLHVLDHYGK